jgi:hypothetical protein
MASKYYLLPEKIRKKQRKKSKRKNSLTTKKNSSIPETRSNALLYLVGRSPQNVFPFVESVSRKSDGQNKFLQLGWARFILAATTSHSKQTGGISHGLERKKEGKPEKMSDSLELVLAGALTGAITKTAIAPLERVKILLQIQGMKSDIVKGEKVYSGNIFKTTAQVVRDEGVLSLWKGNFANVLRIIPNYALKFALNDQLRDKFVREKNQKVEDMTFNQLMAAGTLAGLLQMGTTYPLETIRTRLTLSQKVDKLLLACFILIHMYTLF